MRDSLASLVRRRSGGVCEYCHLPQAAHRFTFPIDHVIARQHGGKTVAGNLAAACTRCNLSKGPNIAGIDPDSRALVPLFNPRRERWNDHFGWRGPRLVGLTPIGRATIRVLAINHREAVALRRTLMTSGAFFPSE